MLCPPAGARRVWLEPVITVPREPAAEKPVVCLPQREYAARLKHDGFRLKQSFCKLLLFENAIVSYESNLTRSCIKGAATWNNRTQPYIGQAFVPPRDAAE
jgi:hypothetical protein